MLNPIILIRKLNNRLSENRKVSKTTIFSLFTPLIAGLILFAAIDGGIISVNLSDNRPSVQGVAKTPISSPNKDHVPQTTSEPSSSALPTLEPTLIPAVKKNPTPDPIINCNFAYLGPKQMKQSQCNISFECQIGSQWYIYTDRNKCTADQNATNKQANIYPPCTVYYPVLHYSGTYYLSPTECNNLRNSANSVSSPQQVNIPVPTPIQTTPAPTPTQNNTEYNDLLKRHEEACKGVVAEWNTIKEQFYANEYNNYSSSAEAVQELERRRQTYQQEAYSVGCTQTISL